MERFAVRAYALQQGLRDRFPHPRIAAVPVRQGICLRARLFCEQLLDFPALLPDPRRRFGQRVNCGFRCLCQTLYKPLPPQTEHGKLLPERIRLLSRQKRGMPQRSTGKPLGIRYPPDRTRTGAPAALSAAADQIVCRPPPHNGHRAAAPHTEDQSAEKAAPPFALIPYFPRSIELFLASEPKLRRYQPDVRRADREAAVQIGEAALIDAAVGVEINAVLLRQRLRDAELCAACGKIRIDAVICLYIHRIAQEPAERVRRPFPAPRRPDPLKIPCPADRGQGAFRKQILRKRIGYILRVCIRRELLRPFSADRMRDFDKPARAR